jgi:hypothetical protein
MPADKCYTKKNKNGGNYTTCVDKKGDQLREKDVKPKKKKLVLKEPAKPAPKKKKLVLKEPAKPAPKKKLVLKEPAKAAPLQNVSAHMSALSASAPTAPPANYNMLRPEIRKNILQFAGARSDVDGLINEIIIAKGGFPKKIRLVEKYNNMFNSKQPYLMATELAMNKPESNRLFDKGVKFDKQIKSLKDRMPKVTRPVGFGRTITELADEQDPEDMAELDRLKMEKQANESLKHAAFRPKSLDVHGADKHIFIENQFEMKGGKSGIMKIFRAMKDKIDRPVLIKILKKVLESL